VTPHTRRSPGRRRVHAQCARVSSRSPPLLLLRRLLSHERAGGGGGGEGRERERGRGRLIRPDLIRHAAWSVTLEASTRSSRGTLATARGRGRGEPQRASVEMRGKSRFARTSHASAAAMIHRAARTARRTKSARRRGTRPPPRLIFGTEGAGIEILRCTMNGMRLGN